MQLLKKLGVVVAMLFVLTGSSVADGPPKELFQKYHLSTNPMGSLCGTTENVINYLDEAGALPMMRFKAIALPGQPDMEFWAVDSKANAGLLVLNNPDNNSCIITPMAGVEWQEENMQKLLNRFLGLII